MREFPPSFANWNTASPFRMEYSSHTLSITPLIGPFNVQDMSTVLRLSMVDWYLGMESIQRLEE